MAILSTMGQPTGCPVSEMQAVPDRTGGIGVNNDAKQRQRCVVWILCCATLGILLFGCSEPSKSSVVSRRGMRVSEVANESIASGGEFKIWLAEG